jgi:hypothetical protein
MTRGRRRAVTNSTGAAAAVANSRVYRGACVSRRVCSRRAVTNSRGAAAAVANSSVQRGACAARRVVGRSDELRSSSATSCREVKPVPPHLCVIDV